MHRHAFTPIEGLWFARNLPCSEAKRVLHAQESLASGSRDQVQWRVTGPGLERGNPVAVKACEFAMRRARSVIRSRSRRNCLLGRAASVISEFRFHTRHPPMAIRGSPPDATRARDLST